MLKERTIDVGRSNRRPWNNWIVHRIW